MRGAVLCTVLQEYGECMCRHVLHERQVNASDVYVVTPNVCLYSLSHYFGYSRFDYAAR